MKKVLWEHFNRVEVKEGCLWISLEQVFKGEYIFKEWEKAT